MKPIENAANQPKPKRRQVLTIGGVGTGKTTHARTLKGKKFAYLFDPNSAVALRGSDIDFVEFIPTITDVNIAARTLKSADKATAHDKSTADVEPRTYPEFEADFTERLQKQFFEPYEWICFDSATTLQDIIMDRVLYLAGRPGKHPEQADWTSEMNIFKKVMRVAAGLANIYMTAHVETEKDELTGKIHGRIMMTGKNRIRVPLMFSDIFACFVYEGKYWIKTVPDSRDPVVRTNIRGLAPLTDVTIEWKKPLEGQGVGRFIE